MQNDNINYIFLCIIKIVSISRDILHFGQKFSILDAFLLFFSFNRTPSVITPGGLKNDYRGEKKMKKDDAPLFSILDFIWQGLQKQKKKKDIRYFCSEMICLRLCRNITTQKIEKTGFYDRLSYAFTFAIV